MVTDHHRDCISQIRPFVFKNILAAAVAFLLFRFRPFKSICAVVQAAVCPTKTAMQLYIALHSIFLGIFSVFEYCSLVWWLAAYSVRKFELRDDLCWSNGIVHQFNVRVSAILSYRMRWSILLDSKNPFQCALRKIWLPNDFICSLSRKLLAMVAFDGARKIILQ